MHNPFVQLSSLVLDHLAGQIRRTVSLSFDARGNAYLPHRPVRVGERMGMFGFNESKQMSGTRSADDVEPMA